MTATIDATTIADWIRSNGPVPAAEAADRFGIPIATIDALVAAGEVPRSLILAGSSRAGNGLTITAAAAAVAAVWERILADAGTAGLPTPAGLSVGLYDRNRRPGDPSPAALTSRFGWHAVCRDARVPAGTGRPTYRRRWGTTDLLAWTGRYAEAMIAADRRITFEGYDRWRGSDPAAAGAPSGALIRTRLRAAGYARWADMVTAGLATLRHGE